MIAVLIVLIICASALVAQQVAIKAECDEREIYKRLKWLDDRITDLEVMERAEFNKHDFDDLKNKVEALRISMGIKRG